METERQTQIRSGAFATETAVQAQRLNTLRMEIRAHRERYEGILAPDPHKLADKDGSPYWGSRQHLLESMLVLLESRLRAAK